LAKFLWDVLPLLSHFVAIHGYSKTAGKLVGFLEMPYNEDDINQSKFKMIQSRNPINTERRNSESIVFEGPPSLFAGINIFIPCFLLSWLLFPIIVAVIEWLRLRTTNYKVTSERIIVTSGILSRLTEEIEIYRIRDIAVEVPFLLRLVGKANLRFISKDKTAPDITLLGLDDVINLKEAVRNNIETLRTTKRRII
jgi:membrane protein YdbS with pleckstrin-like domain